MASVAVIHKGMNRQAGVSTVLVDQMEDKRGGEINNNRRLCRMAVAEGPDCRNDWSSQSSRQPLQNFQVTVTVYYVHILV